jgi:hypothetical protein
MCVFPFCYNFGVPIQFADSIELLERTLSCCIMRHGEQPGQLPTYRAVSESLTLTLSIDRITARLKHVTPSSQPVSIMSFDPHGSSAFATMILMTYALLLLCQ